MSMKPTLLGSAVLLGLGAVVSACATPVPVTGGNTPPPAGSRRGPMQPIDGFYWLEDTIDRGQSASCTAAIPASAMVLTAVYLAINDTTDSMPVRVRPYAAMLARAIARRVHMRFGPSGDTVPRGEPHVTWQGAGGEIRLTARRDGRIERTEPQGDPAVTAGVRMVVSALDAAIAAGEVPPWPSALPDSSISITLRLFTPMVSLQGRVWGAKPDLFVPLFDVLQPPMEPVKYQPGQGPAYPRGPRSARVMGRFEFTFVVDTTGRIDMGTVLLKKHERRPAGVLDVRDRDQFLESLYAYFRRARFEPARIGDCRIRQLLDQAYEFRVE